MDQKQVIAAFKRKNAKVFAKMQTSYDRADWHFKSVTEYGLDSLAAYLPGGMLLAWAVGRDLVSSDFAKENESALQQYKNGALSPAALYKATGGILNQKTFNSQANAFLAHYEEEYLTDYLAVVERGASDYHVEDSPSNFAKVKAIFDKRFEESLE